ncbi:MAG: universal stress protein [Actinomycetota bacterium]
MRILYAVDGSENSLAGTQLLSRLRLTRDDTVEVLGVAEGETTEATEEAVSMAVAGIPTEPLVTRTVAQRDRAADEILASAEKLGVDLILLGARGHSGLAGLVLGTVADRVLRRSHCPVLLARPVRHDLNRVVLGVDDSEGSAAAAAFLQRLPLPAECEVRLLTLLPTLDQIQQEQMVVSPPLADAPTTLADLQRDTVQQRLSALADTFTAAGVTAVTEMRGCDAVDGLLATARDEGADLLVIGSHSRGPVERFFLGSTSETVAQQAGCSVLVVKPGPTAAG